jgi:hypothetical protein
MLAPLAFEADRRAEARGDEKIEAGFGERCGHATPQSWAGAILKPVKEMPHSPRIIHVKFR